MFIQKLWQHSKVFFLGFIFYIVLFAFINFKKGAIIAPVYQYGMFAGKFHLRDTQTVVLLVADKKDTINFADFKVADRDKLQFYAENLPFCEENNKQRMATFKSIFSKVGAGGLITESKFFCNTDKEKYSAWYLDMLNKIAGKNYQIFEVYKLKYTWENNRFSLTDRLN